MNKKNVIRCYDCGREYNKNGWIEAIIPDKVWNDIRPDGCAEDCGLLCINCISDRLYYAGYNNVPVWLCGTEPLKTMNNNSVEKLDIMRNWSKGDG